MAALLEALFSQGDNTECQASDCRGATSNRTCCFPVVLGGAFHTGIGIGPGRRKPVHMESRARNQQAAQREVQRKGIFS